MSRRKTDLKPAYETERLYLVRTEPGLAKKVCEYFTRNREFLRATEAVHSPDFYTVGYQRALLRQIAKRQKQGREARFWLVAKDGNGSIIGTVSLNSIIYGPFCSAFLSYRLDKDLVGGGLATEAVERMVRIAFQDLGLHRIEANIMPRNKASLRVVEKLGFQSEGVSPSYLSIGGVWEDHVHMVLLNEAWKPSL